MTATTDAPGTPGNTTAVACLLSEREQAMRGDELGRDLFSRVEEVAELPDGYAYRFSAEEAWTDALLGFVAAERRCCPFLTFELAFAPNGGPLWLRLRGPAESKAFVLAHFGGLVPGAVPTAASADAGVTERNKVMVRRLVDEVMNTGRLDTIDEIFAPALAADAKRWIAPFRSSFPDMRMEIVDLVAEGDTVVGRFACSGTHQGDWLGHAPTGRRFESVAEVYFFHLVDGRITEAWGLEDTLARLDQLGLRRELGARGVRGSADRTGTPTDRCAGT